MAKFEGKFADYMSEADNVPDPIELKLARKTVKLCVPTKTQLTEYYDVQANEQLSPRERGDLSWVALLGDNYQDVMAYFDARPFYEFQRFQDFVNLTWFGAGADDVEGK